MINKNKINKFINEIYPVRDSDSKSVLRQWYEILRIALTAQFTPNEYYLYEIHRKDKSIGELSRYMSNSLWLDRVMPALTDSQWEQILENKWLFNQYYSSLKLPVPKAYAFLTNDGGMTSNGCLIDDIDDLITYLHTEQPESLVVKPLCGYGGRFITVLDSLLFCTDDLIGESCSGNDQNFRSLCETILRYKRRNSGLLVETKINQHAFFDYINPYTISTLKIITFLKKNLEPEILSAAVKFGRKGSEVDTISRGGFSRGVDIQNGYLNDWGLLSDKTHSSIIIKHPDTNENFEWLKIPMWRDIVATIQRFSRNTIFARIVSWDVILSDEGPVVIEGELNPRLDIMQCHSGGFMTDTFIPKLNEFGITIDDTKLSKIKISSFRSALRRWL